jgi:hypothetical protein
MQRHDPERSDPLSPHREGSFCLAKLLSHNTEATNNINANGAEEGFRPSCVSHLEFMICREMAHANVTLGTGNVLLREFWVNAGAGFCDLASCWKTYPLRSAAGAFIAAAVLRARRQTRKLHNAEQTNTT